MHPCQQHVVLAQLLNRISFQQVLEATQLECQIGNTKHSHDLAYMIHTFEYVLVYFIEYFIILKNYLFLLERIIHQYPSHVSSTYY